jgi:uncharacterized phage-associated protein
MDAVPVANHILWKANKDHVNISPMKLQKMLYFLHGWYLAITGQKLIDEGFMRWDYGPVVPSVYRELKNYGSAPIDDYIKQYDPNSEQLVPMFVNTNAFPQFNEVLERVWQQYSKFSGPQLSQMTHEFDTPWSNTYPNFQIRDDLIQEYFTRQAFNNQNYANGQKFYA